MTNYTDLPSVALVQQEMDQYVFNKEKPDQLNQCLSTMLVDLIKQRGFKEYDPQCLALLQSTLIDFYHDFSIRFKQHIESIGSSITFQDAFERTLDDVMSSNLRELYHYMKSM